MFFFLLKRAFPLPRSMHRSTSTNESQVSSKLTHLKCGSVTNRAFTLYPISTTVHPIPVQSPTMMISEHHWDDGIGILGSMNYGPHSKFSAELWNQSHQWIYSKMSQICWLCVCFKAARDRLYVHCRPERLIGNGD